nr:MAG TPA: hypothetical protein [Bacteriophage sp.]
MRRRACFIRSGCFNITSFTSTSSSSPQPF